ncbi:MAG: hypothetical protein ABGW77_04770 [Campylobacterales bacterium]
MAKRRRSEPTPQPETQPTIGRESKTQKPSTPPPSTPQPGESSVRRESPNLNRANLNQTPPPPPPPGGTPSSWSNPTSTGTSSKKRPTEGGKGRLLLWLGIGALLLIGGGIAFYLFWYKPHQAQVTTAIAPVKPPSWGGGKEVSQPTPPAQQGGGQSPAQQGEQEDIVNKVLE